MKILYLCADRGISLEKHNGATAHFRSLVRAYQSLGHEVLVLTPGNAAPDEIGADVARIETPGVLDSLLAEVDRPVRREERDSQRVRRRVVHALGHIWNNVVSEQEIERQVEQFAPDFVFELYSPFGVAGTITCARLGVPHVLNVHAPLAWEGREFRSQALQEAAEALEDIAFTRAGRIVANSSEMRNYLTGAGVDQAKIDVVPNGVDLDLFSPDGEKRRPAANAIVVGFSGSLKAWHGVDILVDAFRLAAPKDPRLHLTVVGDGPQRKLIESISAELPGRVTATGAIPLEEVPAWIRGMDIAVAPYPPFDPFYFSPLKILDAMACGVCNVASNIGQIPELVRDGVTGVLVPPGDKGALADAILTLANDADTRSRMGSRARAEAERMHSWSTRAAEIVSIATGPPDRAERKSVA